MISEGSIDTEDYSNAALTVITVFFLSSLREHLTNNISLIYLKIWYTLSYQYFLF